MDVGTPDPGRFRQFEQTSTVSLDELFEVRSLQVFEPTSSHVGKWRLDVRRWQFRLLAYRAHGLRLSIEAQKK